MASPLVELAASAVAVTADLERPIKQIYHDRIAGCIFGSALGDAIGLYTEFLSAATSTSSYPSGKFSLLPPDGPTPYRVDSHREPHKLGDWTDDTDQALCILLSFLHSNGELSAMDFAQRLRVWVDQGLRALDTLPLGLGMTVGSVVRNKEFLVDPESVSRAFWEKKDFLPAPNGSLMRTHPLGLMCLDRDIEKTMDIAAKFSEVTHVDPRCLVSCAIGIALVRGLVRGEIQRDDDIDEIVQAGVKWFEKRKDRQVREDPSRNGHPGLDLVELQKHTGATTLEELELDDRQKIGYVYKCLGSGILLLRIAMREEQENSHGLAWQLSIFERLITRLIMCGGDADTNACFAGALLGAFLGYKTLPPHWRDGLRHHTWLLEKSESLCRTLKVLPGEYDGTKDPDTAIDGGRGFLDAKTMDTRRAGLLEEILLRRKKLDFEEREQLESQKPRGGVFKSAVRFVSRK